MRSKQLIAEVKHLAVRRSGKKILDDLSWTIRSGEHWVILGANGSGKTSLLSVMTGYMTPTSGDVSVLGREYGNSDWRELRERIGIVSSTIRQRIPDYDSVLEVVVGGKYAMIDFWGKITAQDRARARRILKDVGCEKLADREWGVLSQGERQRVLIARAWMADPIILILDEPCAGLDPVAREHFLGFLQRLGKSPSSPTLVFVTHHVEEIMPVFSKVMLLKKGRMIASGAKKDALTTPVFSEAFDSAVKVRKVGSRYALEVKSASRRFV